MQLIILHIVYVGDQVLMLKHLAIGAIACACLPGQSQASPVIFLDMAVFSQSIGSRVIDTYETELGYLDERHPSAPKLVGPGQYTDSLMSEVLGETRYKNTTAFADWSHIIMDPPHYVGNKAYVLNGSVQLSFDSTSVSANGGVNAVGFEISEHWDNLGASENSQPFVATVNLLNGQTFDFEVPLYDAFTASTDLINYNPADRPFWGIISDVPIVAIHLGGPSNSVLPVNPDYSLSIDTLIVGAMPVSEAPTAALLFLGIASALLLNRQRPTKGSTSL